MNITESLVPDGLRLFKERSASAARRVAVLVGSGGLVTSYSKGSGEYTEYSVDIEMLVKGKERSVVAEAKSRKLWDVHIHRLTLVQRRAKPIS